jgi:hypothetical protein
LFLEPLLRPQQSGSGGLDLGDHNVLAALKSFGEIPKFALLFLKLGSLGVN